MEQLSSNVAFGGSFTKYKFTASALGGLETQINVFLPKEAKKGGGGGKVPVLYYLAGLTCNEDTGAQKGGFLRDAAEHGISLVFPDTSPRGAGIDGEDADWDFGTGAGFYLDATNPKFSKHYNLEKLITEELPKKIEEEGLPIDTKNASIFGHSMGGHGALTLYLNHPGLYKSSSAFAPIANPTECQWGQKAFAGPNGNDGYLKGGVEEGKKYDATEIVRSKKPSKVAIFIDYGDGDNFYKQGQLRPESFQSAIDEAGLSSGVEIRQQPGYDHSYWFISTFGPDHIAFHAKHLKK